MERRGEERFVSRYVLRIIEMGLLDHLWDDTVAGPLPNTGLKKLRKQPSAPPAPVSSSSGAVPVSRSITILRPAIQRSLSIDSASLPSSSSSASDPGSPLTPRTPRGDWRNLRRKPPAEGLETAEPRSPTAYDWVVISALDR